ncbi:MAG: carboxypeptidase regulatory-like domain-containing protein [Acidobacteriota bacterium]|nr:carboxypeptidase regulatory-like domain-containing protein [Acidobacteriota bacterium]
MDRILHNAVTVRRRLLLLCVTVVSLFVVAAGAKVSPALAGGGAPDATPKPTPKPKPGPPAKIVFDPPEPSVQPGTQITITAKVLDKENREIDEKDAPVKFDIADEAHKAFLISNQEGNRLTVAGLFNSTGTSGDKGAGGIRPSLVPFIVKYPAGDEKPTLTRVLNVALTNGGPPPGPVPPGLKPQVDVMWSVLPGNVVHANFGRKIRGDYYGIQIVIGNNSGYDLQIAAAGFTLKQRTPSPSGVNYPLPAASYQLARGSIAREQEIGPRARIVNSLDALGPVLTGFVPFFHIVNHKANFSQFVNVFSNPLNAGVKLVAPDTVIGQLGRLEQQTFRNDQTARTIIPNNTQISIVTFFPREELRNYMQGTLGFNKNDLDDPMKVMDALGDLVLVGQQVQYLNRVRLIGDNTQTGQFSISGRVVDECGDGIADVDVKLSDGPFFKETTVKTNAEGVYLFEKVPAGDDYKVTATKAGVTIKSEGGDSFRLADNRTDVNFRGTQSAYTIAGKVTGPTGQGIKDIEVALSGGKTATTKTKDDGSYSFEGLTPGLNYVVTPKNGGGFVFDPATNAGKANVDLLNCNRTNVNFNGNPAP